MWCKPASSRSDSNSIRLSFTGSRSLLYSRGGGPDYSNRRRTIVVRLLSTLRACAMGGPIASIAPPSNCTERRELARPCARPRDGSGRRSARRRATSGDGSAFTDFNGEFSISVWPGTYTVSIKAEGFQEASQLMSGTAGGAELPEFILQLKTIHYTVTVVESLDYQVAALNSATKT
jgi:hypothetical protein